VPLRLSKPKIRPFVNSLFLKKLKIAKNACHFKFFKKTRPCNAEAVWGILMKGKPPEKTGGSKRTF